MQQLKMEIANVSVYRPFFGLHEDIICYIFALTYAKDSQFIPKVVQGKDIYRTKFQVRKSIIVLVNNK